LLPKKGEEGMETVEIIPAILAKKREEFAAKLSAVAPFAKRVQIDIMDGEFVPNTTLQPKDFPPLPEGMEATYHLMVKDPLSYAKEIGRKGAIYELHVEALGDIGGAVARVKGLGGRVALAISPDTPAELLLPYKGKIEHALVMSVYPGFSGQKYIGRVEGKMRLLSQSGIRVAVDGGVGIGSARSAARAGATLLYVASAIFEKPDVKRAIEEIKEDAEIGAGKDG